MGQQNDLFRFFRHYSTPMDGKKELGSLDIGHFVLFCTVFYKTTDSTVLPEYKEIFPTHHI